MGRSDRPQLAASYATQTPYLIRGILPSLFADSKPRKARPTVGAVKTEARQ